MSRQPKQSSGRSKHQRRDQPESSGSSSGHGEQSPATPPAPLGNLFADIDEALPVYSDSRMRLDPAPRQVEPVSPRSAPVVPASARDDEEHDRRRARQPYEQARANVRHAERTRVPPYLGYPPLRAPAPILVPDQILRLLLVGLISVVILLTLWPNSSTILSDWVPLGKSSTAVENGLVNVFAPARPAGDYSLQGPPSITAEQVNAILSSYGSPAAGTGQAWVDLGRNYGIDPAFAVAFFIHESSAGTNPGWAGIKPDGTTTHNVGNIICAGYDRCFGRFRDYASWEEGIEDWYRLIDVEYIKGRGTVTVDQIVPIYAPSFENDVQGYINAVTQMVDGWRVNGVR